MTVEEIVPVDKRRSKIVLEEGLTLVLYRGELRRFGIETGGELTQDTYQKILNEVLVKRARERVICLLKSSDKTEKELRSRLKAGGYPQEAIDEALRFVKNHRFINDEDYGLRYVEYHSRNKSERQIRYELQQKGLEKDVIEELLEGHPVDEEAQIRNYIKKKRINPQEMEFSERRKVTAALGRKGFSFETVNRVLGNFYEEY